MRTVTRWISLLIAAAGWVTVLAVLVVQGAGGPADWQAGFNSLLTLSLLATAFYGFTSYLPELVKVYAAGYADGIRDAKRWSGFDEKDEPKPHLEIVR